MSTLLHITRLRHRVGDRVLLDIENFLIERASATILTGANGAGKTTLLRILAGLERADTCQLSWCGEQQNLQPWPRRLRKAIIYVHQHPVMFATSVQANLAYGLRLRLPLWQQLRGHLPEPERIDEALHWAGLEHLRHHPANSLSGGEKQRLALARARILQPPLLLLDEPTANLDGAAREQVIALIPDLRKDGRSVIIACHDRDLTSLPNINRVKLRDGKLQIRAR